MSKELMKKDNNNMKRNEPDEILTEPSYWKTPFFSFRYSYRELSSFGGKTHIKAKEKRFENGKFESGEFEGIMDGGVFDNAIREMQHNFVNQISSFFKPLAFFLPFSKKKSKKE